MKEGKSAKGTHKKGGKTFCCVDFSVGTYPVYVRKYRHSLFIFYGGEEYEEATYGRGGKTNKYIICTLLILPLLLSSVDI